MVSDNEVLSLEDLVKTMQALLVSMELARISTSPAAQPRIHGRAVGGAVLPSRVYMIGEDGKPEMRITGPRSQFRLPGRSP